MTENADAKTAVLFVCLGNICRSPMAEGAFREAARQADLNIEADSVGTAAYHIGEAPDPRAIATARKHGVSISALAGRQLDMKDFERFSHIFALDTANLAGIRARAPRSPRAAIGLLMDTVPGREGTGVADPYHGDESDFDKAWEEIDLAVRHLVEKLKRGEL